ASKKHSLLRFYTTTIDSMAETSARSESRTTSFKEDGMDDSADVDQFPDDELHSLSPADELQPNDPDEDLWAERMREYKAEVLTSEDAEEAVLGRHNATLIELCADFETAIRDVLTASGVSVET